MGRLLQKMPVLCAVAVVPFITHAIVLQVSPELLPYSKFQPTEVDVFSWWKSRFVIFFGLVAIATVALFVKNNKISESAKSILFCLLTYAVLIALSSLNSRYPHSAWLGLADYNEGAITLLAYLALMASSYLFFRSDASLKNILLAATFPLGVVFILAVLQNLFGNFLALPFLRALVTSDEHIRLFSTYRPLTSTMLNSNHLGTFAAISLPLMLAHTFTSKLKVRWFGVILCFMSLYLLIGSESRGAWLTLGIVLISFLLIFRNYLRRYILGVLAVLVVIGCLSVGFVSVVTPKLLATYVDLKDILNGSKIHASDLQHLSAKNGVVRVVAKGIGLQIRTDQAGYHFEGLDSRGLRYFFDAGKVSILEPGYDLFKINLKNTNPSYMELIIGKSVFEFMPTIGGLKAWAWGTAFDTPSVKRIKWPLPDTAFSGRAYIWSVTLPLLNDTLFIGKGPATFTHYFPQMDIYGKFSAGWSPNSIIDRPHNLFLQIIHATGFLSFLLFVYLLYLFLVPAGRILFDRNVEWNQRNLCLLGFFGASIAFLVNGLFNDSMVGTSPLFWVCFGTGLGLVHQYDFETLKIKKVTARKKINRMVPTPT